MKVQKREIGRAKQKCTFILLLPCVHTLYDKSGRLLKIGISCQNCIAINLLSINKQIVQPLNNYTIKYMHYDDMSSRKHEKKGGKQETIHKKVRETEEEVRDARGGRC